MAKDKEEKKVEAVAVEEAVAEPAVKAPAEGSREARFADLLESYKKQNPVKYEAKKARGEFNQIPDSFV